MYTFWAETMRERHNSRPGTLYWINRLLQICSRIVYVFFLINKWWVVCLSISSTEKALKTQLLIIENWAVCKFVLRAQLGNCGCFLAAERHTCLLSAFVLRFISFRNRACGNTTYVRTEYERRSKRRSHLLPLSAPVRNVVHTEKKLRSLREDYSSTESWYAQGAPIR